ncbi:Putative serine/threonine-protein kinase Sps1 [Mariniradius saccharolyticus AK6]|uniref:Serine/threonine-protein kinase Sps1 n=1 Tax=Mariniradius saccharolyticus AK6 TaxID=1239962 RepID=M7XBS0_9BACT|nr:PASTA domain-containing protein [Mariniradius saccharolyticus]EMS32324.1 Putative serine/threonine-protein kinase Sps1 [Mariniradius saccharolyticus AK6]
MRESFKKIGLHLLLVFVAFTVLGFLFLKVYLPFYTNHGQTVSVPNLEGFSVGELEDYLKARDLTYEVALDSGFSTEMRPHTVMKQIPKPESKVKKGRKIYVTLNAQNAPLLRMPNLVNSPLKNAQEILSNMGLLRGEIIYVPDIAPNVVLEQKYRGRSIPEGFEVPKGAQIDLVVGDGLGNQALELPNFVGMDEVDAEFLLIGSGLRMGNINYVETDTVPSGIIIRQFPPAGVSVKTGEGVELWISESKNRTN